MAFDDSINVAGFKKIKKYLCEEMNGPPALRRFTWTEKKDMIRSIPIQTRGDFGRRFGSLRPTKGGGGVVKAIVDKLRDAERKAEKLVKDAEVKAEKETLGFEKERQRRLEIVRAECEAMRQNALMQAKERAKREEIDILAETQRQVNEVRARADKKKEEAIGLITRKIREQ